MRPRIGVRPMNQTTVQTSTRAATRTSGKPSLRPSTRKNDGKKVRRNGLVASTILLDPETDKCLSALAFAWQKERSELVRQMIGDRLSRYDIAEELTKAAARFKSSDAARSDEGSNRPSEATDSSEEICEAA